jgi:hypothetical protein
MPKPMTTQTIKGQTSPTLPPGLIELYDGLSHAFPGGLKYADALMVAEAGTTAFELSVTAEQLEETMEFVSRMLVEIEHRYHEIYSVVVTVATE